MIDLRQHIRDVPDFPQPGIVFKDITPLLGNRSAFDAAIEQLADPWRNERISHVAGIESRGFIFGAAMARFLSCGFVPVRKPGKLPWKIHRREYQLEYGSDALEVHQDAVGTGDRVLIVDDVLATGGTGTATAELFSQFDAEVIGLSVLIELEFLHGREKLGSTRVHSVLKY